MRRFPRTQRAGVVLIVVLGILALFALVGITFLLSTEQGVVASKAVASIEQSEDPPETLLERSLAQVLVGSTNSRSVLQHHSLLEDVYGEPIQVGTLTGVAANPVGTSNGQAGLLGLDLPVPRQEYYNGLVLTMITGNCAGKSTRIIQSRSAGSVLVFPFEGMRLDPADPTRWDADTAPAQNDQFVINGRPFNGMGFGYDKIYATGVPTGSTAGLLDLTPRRLAFDRDIEIALGMGPPAQGTLAPQLAPQIWPGLLDFPMALLPNPRAPEWQALLNPNPAVPEITDFAPVQADEDYDAVDYQNMLLALYVHTASSTLGGRFVSENEVTIPSLHRPALINFWRTQASSLGLSNLEERALLRRISLRPLVEDHPEFALTNPSYNDVLGPWDVDNDRDGRPDSIWVDLGFEVQQDSEGRNYKPLAALLVRDLDSKLNLNAHGQVNEYHDDRGTNSQIAMEQKAAYHWTNAPEATLAGANALSGSNPVTTLNLPAGMGLSPAEISLLPYSLSGLADNEQVNDVYGNINRTYLLLQEDEFRNLFYGRVMNNGVVIPGKYGEARYVYTNGDSELVQYEGRPHLSTSAAGPQVPGAGATTYNDNYPPEPAHPNVLLTVPGRGNTKLHGTHGSSAFASNNALPARNIYGSPLDIDGNGAIGVDPTGQPRFFMMGRNSAGGQPTETREHVDDPTELNLFTRDSHSIDDEVVLSDEPFTPVDLDWLLRPFDPEHSEESFTAGIRPSVFDDWDVNSNAASASRLFYLLGRNTKRDYYKRSLLTTESWEIPVPSFVPTQEMLTGLAIWNQRVVNNGRPELQRIVGELTLEDLLLGKIAYVRQNFPNQFANVSGAYPDAMTSVLTDLVNDTSLLDADLGTGLRLNVNRPFGNGVDDEVSGNRNGVVDDYAEVNTERVFDPSISFDHNSDGRLDNDDLDVRQRMARQLYLLMMLVKDYTYAIPDDEGLTAQERGELTAQRIAQWAVNVVDFRDPDNIMTPFEYDIQPFDGWHVDNAVNSTDDGTNVEIGPMGGTFQNQRRVVWGCEKPVLLLTESLALHDLRIDDTDQEGSMMMPGATTQDTPPDDDWDQPRIPQGHAFFELFCAENPNNNRSSGDLFDANHHLHLARHVNNSPVWRLVITEPVYDNGNDNARNSRSVYSEIGNTDPDPTVPVPTPADGRPASGSLEPDQLLPTAGAGGLVNAFGSGQKQFSLVHDSAGMPENLIRPDRYVYFVPNANFDRDLAGLADIANVDDRVFLYTGNGNLLVPRGGYAVVGTAGRNPNDNNTYLGAPGNLLEIDYGASGNQFSLRRGANPIAPFDQLNTEIRPVVGIPCAQTALANVGIMGNKRDLRVGLNVSEPLLDVDAPDLNGWYVTELNSAYLEANDPSGMSADPAGFQGTEERLVESAGMSPPARPADTPFDHNDLYDTSIGKSPERIPRYSYVFLQRLANPLQQWDSLTNPYISVDWMPMDLVIYTSVNRNGNTAFGAGGIEIDLMSTERGATRDLWSQLRNFEDSGANVHSFPSSNAQNLRATLGYLNHSYGGRLNNTNTEYNDPSLVGFPEDVVFPWLAWNNRPYVSALELLQVPASTPARLLWEFSTYQQQNGSAMTNDLRGGFYESYLGRSETLGMDDVRFGGTPYGHLLNFFSSNRIGEHATDPASNFHRIFEYLTVPSRFSGTQEFLPPSVFNSDATEFPNGSGVLGRLRAPYNYFSKYREPGKVNLNTISESTGLTWGCILNGSLNADWNDVLTSRRGFGGANWFGPESATNHPTLFANPFRAFTNDYYVPLNTLRQFGGNNRFTAEASLLRPRTTDAGGYETSGAIGVEKFPLFSNIHNNTASENGRTGPFNNPLRHSYFQFEPVQRLGNLVTRQSNVYAAWITIGFFEVDKVTVDPGSAPEVIREFQEAYPDGWRLGAELGSDTGEVQRHRGFYIIDRSLPVAFQRGKLHNALDTVIYKRTLQ